MEPRQGQRQEGFIILKKKTQCLLEKMLKPCIWSVIAENSAWFIDTHRSKIMRIGKWWIFLGQFTFASRHWMWTTHSSDGSVDRYTLKKLSSSPWSLAKISSRVGFVTMLRPRKPSPAIPSIINVRICQTCPAMNTVFSDKTMIGIIHD